MSKAAAGRVGRGALAHQHQDVEGVCLVEIVGACLEQQQAAGQARPVSQQHQAL